MRASPEATSHPGRRWILIGLSIACAVVVLWTLTRQGQSTARIDSNGAQSIGATEFAPETSKDPIAMTGVTLDGINVKDNPSSARAFERTFGIQYPSLDDTGGAALLSLSDTVPPTAVPSTIVLDRQGRVSARIIGVVREATLRALMRTALAEPA